MALETVNVKYQRKELELKALLEITQAINENKAASVLLEIFKFTCLVHLNIRSILLYMTNGRDFEKRISHGVKNLVPTVIPESKVTYEKDSHQLKIEVESPYSFEELENYLPVFHKDKMLAILFLKKKDERNELDLDFTQALTNIMVVALENKRFAKRQLEQERLRREMEIASNVQRMLFPALMPNTPKMSAKVTYIPHSTVGGDYYDLVQTSEDEVFFCIADVSGKGMPAALLMSNFQAALRTLLRSTKDLNEIVRQLNATIYENTKGERFITFFLGHYHFKNRRLRFVNAGHNPAQLCWDGENRIDSLGAGTTVVGAFEVLPFLETGSREHLTHFSLHLYTDGLTERFNDAQEPYGDERFQQFVKENPNVGPEEFHKVFFRELDRFAGKGEQTDDVTLLSIRFR